MNFRQQSIRQSIQFQQSLETARQPSSKIVKTKPAPLPKKEESISEPKLSTPIEKEVKPIEQPKVEESKPIEIVEQPKATKQSNNTNRLPNLGK